MQASILLGLAASANAMSLRRPSDPTVPVRICIKCDCSKQLFLDTTYGGITQDEITDLRQRLHSHCQYHKVHKEDLVPWETLKTWPLRCYTTDWDTEYAMPNLQIMRARLRTRSCSATLRRSRSPRRDPVFRDTANPIRDTASDPNGTLAPKLDYITNKLTNVHRKLDSITERLDKWEARWAQDEKEDEKTTK